MIKPDSHIMHIIFILKVLQDQWSQLNKKSIFAFFVQSKYAPNCWAQVVPHKDDSRVKAQNIFHFYCFLFLFLITFLKVKSQLKLYLV